MKRITLSLSYYSTDLWPPSDKKAVKEIARQKRGRDGRFLLFVLSLMFMNPTLLSFTFENSQEDTPSRFPLKSEFPDFKTVCAKSDSRLSINGCWDIKEILTMKNFLICSWGCPCDCSGNISFFMVCRADLWSICSWKMCEHGVNSPNSHTTHMRHQASGICVLRSFVFNP